MIAYAIVFATAAVATYLATFVVRRIVVRVRAVVMPDERRLHDRPLPTIGGAAMFVAFLIAMAVATQLSQFNEIFSGSSEPLGVILAATVIFAVGTIDDLREVSPPAKLAGTVLAGSVLYFLGVTMYYFRIPFADFVSVTPDWAPLLTVLWLCGMTTAVNYIDGLDGLAAGIVAIASGSFFLYAHRLGDVGLLGPDNIGPLIAVITCGVCLGFLPAQLPPGQDHHGRRRGAVPRAVHGGVDDGRSGAAPTDPFAGQTYFFFAPLFIPLFILGIPIIDTAFVTLRRAARRRESPRRTSDHLHHRLERMGHGHRRAVSSSGPGRRSCRDWSLFPTLTERGQRHRPARRRRPRPSLLYTLFHPGIRAEVTDRHGRRRRSPRPTRRWLPSCPSRTQAGVGDAACGVRPIGGLKIRFRLGSRRICAA